MENKNIETVDSTSKSIDETQYTVTLLFSYFAGGLGIHRLLNGKKVSGMIMMLLSIVILPLFLILLTVGLINDSKILWITGLLSIPVIFVLIIWVISDFFTIISGKFKNSNNEEVKSGKSFFRCFANIIVILVIIFNLIISSVSSMFLADPINKAFQSYLDGEFDLRPTVVVDKDVEALNQNMSQLSNCLYLEDKEVKEFEDYDSIIDPITAHFEELGYKPKVNKRQNNIIFSKNENNVISEFGIDLKKTSEGYKMDRCYLNITNDLDAIYTVSLDEKSSKKTKSYYVMVYDGDQINVLGSYVLADDEFELYEIIPSGKTEYDAENDEYQIVKELNDLIDKLTEEEEDIFDY